jgi:hypothetical protein
LKIKIKITFLLPLLLSGCATIVTEKKETEVFTFDYATKCIDKEHKKVHFFETDSYTPLSFTEIYKSAKLKGSDKGFDITGMNCFQISSEFIDL